MNNRLRDKVVMVIPSINGGELLRRMLPTLRCSPTCVVVLDQGSTDGTEVICDGFGVSCLQLGRPHTYTQACNIGAQLARDRGAPFLCVANNDILFRTDVLSELLSEMEQDPSLGIVAPTQVIIQDDGKRELLTTRVFWRLSEVEFGHDFETPSPLVQRLESDFCELTCALIRISAIERVGFLDDEYGFYHEDADFGFRLRKAGLNCAYLQHSQIDHYSSSTFNKDRHNLKSAYLAKNRQLFAEKHLGYGVSQILNIGAYDRHTEEAIRDLIPYLRRYGLIEPKRPEMVVGNPGADSRGYLYTLAATDGVPARWSRHSDKYAAIFTTSERARSLYVERGFQPVFSIPPAVETDIFHPWVTASPLDDSPTYLAILDGQEPLISVLLAAWRRFRAGGAARLIVFGRSVSDCMGRSPDERLRVGRVHRLVFKAESVEVLEIVSPLSAPELAQLYRSVDFTISAASSPRAIRSALESIACGVPCLLPRDALGLDAALLGSLDLGPASGLAADRVLCCLEESRRLSSHDRATLSSFGVRSVRGSFTLRHSAMAFYNAVSHIQPSSPEDLVSRLDLHSLRNPQMQAGRQPEAAQAKAGGFRRAGRPAARRVAAFGNLTAQFGAVWNEHGFDAARRKTYKDIRALLTSRRAGGAAPVAGDAAIPLKQVKGGGNHATGQVQRGPLLIGYIDAQLGLGQSSRGLAEAMAGTSLDFRIYPITTGVEGRRGAPFMEDRYDRRRPHAVNVIEVTPDELPAVVTSVGRAHFDHSYNILRTYWELSRAPNSWRSIISGIDEVWVPNEFVAESFRTIFDGPITIIPPCVSAGEPTRQARSQFDLHESCFYFLISFDYFSFPQRKNPLATLRAFRTAFKDRSLPTGLIIKSAGRFDHFPELKREMQEIAALDGRITIIDETLSRQEMVDLFSAADCYVSLHRSEGFGLGMVEAMLLGKPVIATDYSGSADFLSDATGYPVPFQLRAVKPDEYVHTEGQVWAEPDEEACAALMRRVAESPAEAAARGAAARDFVAERYGPLRVGRLVVERLAEINRASRTNAVRR